MNQFAGVDEHEIETKVMPAVVTVSAWAGGLILVVGPTGSGKSTFAKLLAEQLVAGIGETGEVLTELYVDFIVAAGRHTDKAKASEILLASMKQKSESGRRQLVAFGDVITRFAPSALLQGASYRGDIIVGARRKVEVENFGFTVLVEIVAPELAAKDDAYELAGWRPTYGSFGVYTVPRGRFDGWPELARMIAREIRGDGAAV